MKRFATAALAVALGLTGSALAQGVVTDPNVISGCLCSEAAVAALCLFYVITVTARRLD